MTVPGLVIPPELAINLAFIHHSGMRRGLYLLILFQSWLDIHTGPLDNAQANIVIDHDSDEVSLSSSVMRMFSSR